MRQRNKIVEKYGEFTKNEELEILFGENANNLSRYPDGRYRLIFYLSSQMRNPDFHAESLLS